MTKSASRRDFLKGSAALAAGVAVAGQASFARMAHAAGTEKIKAVLIGCGGRGSGAIRDCLAADPAVQVIAVADAFEHQAQGAARSLRAEYKERAKIPDDCVFSGLDAYKKAIDTGCNLVVTATPPGFRPLIYSAAIKAGKNVFMEKPCCVDPVGFKILQAANKLAEEKGLKVGVGFQRRHTPNYMETVKRIHDGMIGDITLLRAYWNGGGIWIRPRQSGQSEMQYQVMNWYHFCWLSGDNICEQHIHNLDVCNWVMCRDGDPQKAHPVKANGMGACVQRYAGKNKGVGQIFDEHFVEFTYADGTTMLSQCRHIPNTWENVSEYVHGINGESNPGGSIKVKGGEGWHFRGQNVNSMVQEHKDLIDAIRSGKKYVEGWHGAASSMTAVLGRLATYSGKVVTWDEAVEKGTTEFPKELAWDAKAPVYQDANGDYPIPVPGQFKPY